MPVRALCCLTRSVTTAPCCPQRRRTGHVVGFAALDPFRGYGTALATALPDAVRVLDAFHCVKLANQVVDEVRRRVQQDTLGHRGHKHDPLYQVRRLLRGCGKSRIDATVWDSTVTSRLLSPDAPVGIRRDS